MRSLGVAAVIGELCCLFAAVIALPAALMWMDHNRRSHAPGDIPSRRALPEGGE